MAATLFVLALIGGCSAQLLALEAPEAPDTTFDDVTTTLSQVSKRDLEFNQYVPAYRLRGEPSCDELRAMWRLSKREARRATSTNQLPRTRPYRYGRLRPFVPPNAYGPRAHSFGTIALDDRHRYQHRMPHTGSFNKLRAMMGTRRPGAFAELRDMIGKERTPSEEDTPRGQFNTLRDMVLKEGQQNPEGASTSTLSRALRYRDDGAGLSIRNDPSVAQSRTLSLPRTRALYQLLGFTGRLLPRDPDATREYSGTPPWTTDGEGDSYERECGAVQGVECRSDSECACRGEYFCSDFHCVGVAQAQSDEFGVWYYEALPPSLLRDWPAEQRRPDD